MQETTQRFISSSGKSVTWRIVELCRRDDTPHGALEAGAASKESQAFSVLVPKRGSRFTSCAL